MMMEEEGEEEREKYRKACQLRSMLHHWGTESCLVFQSSQPDREEREILAAIKFGDSVVFSCATIKFLNLKIFGE